ncbi:MAG TPA: DNA mismatch repair protein MutS [Clostridiaceae bacterium]|nr:DNA mismatch repair protein MutS [Clostridiaceae bacterium]
MKSSRDLYIKRKDTYNRLIEKQTKASNCLSNLRLFTIAAGIAAAVFLYIKHYYILLAATVMVTLILFLYLIVIHEKLTKNIEYATLILKINEDSIKRCDGKWNTYQDDGSEFKDENHYFSFDLDIFGENSLFQWINTAKTYTGRNILARLLTQHPDNLADIVKRQKAVKGLAGKIGWRQRFLAEGLVSAKGMHNPEDLIAWVNNGDPYFKKTCIVFLTRLLPAITVFSLLLASIGSISYYIPVTGLIIQFILLFIKRREREEIYRLAKKYKEDISVYYHMIKMIERQKFSAEYLNELKESMRNKEGQTAWQQVNKLFKIVDSLEDRNNFFYFIFNTLFLWDYQNLIALEKWKGNSGMFLKNWIDAIGNVESLASLSIIGFDNPEWAMPELISSQECIFEAESLGHPLITHQRVNNNLKILPPVHTLLITGSNMSGKSTLLRAAGINLALAYAGAPVCAQYFRVSLMKIYTCMRINDNLSKNISSFYAELLRIKTIVLKASEGEPVFFLLDEIFKGTNSRDRHFGAKVLIKKLCATRSIGMVSTDDLELCILEKENRAVRNYHFQEYYKDGKICFDYKLRPGASTTQNAIYLMKLAGIDVDEENK